MAPETIAIAADHGGFDLKCALKEELLRKGFDVLDLGTESAESVDYPDYARRLTDALDDGRASRGVLLCGSGVGMSIAANRRPGIRAALVQDPDAALLARQHNDANVIVMGGRVIDESTARECLDVFLATPFDGGRHARRVSKLA